MQLYEPRLACLTLKRVTLPLMNVWHLALPNRECAHGDKGDFRIAPHVPRPAPNVNRAICDNGELHIFGIRTHTHPIASLHTVKGDGAALLRGARVTTARSCHVNTQRPASNYGQLSTIPNLSTRLRLGCRGYGRYSSRGGRRRYCRSDVRGDG
jgi:hypothetical protein